jgi:TonB-linked SusC/RagA family outer membrane protein
MKNNYKRTMWGLKYFVQGIFIFAFLCMSSARAERVQREVLKAVSLENYLKKIESAYKVSFVYDATQISKSMSIDAPEKLISINSDLEPLKAKGISYNIIGKQVILKKIPVSTAKIDFIVRGYVTSVKDKEPIPGVSVREKNIANGVSTDGDGLYQIKVKDGATLVFSAIGYKPREIAVAGRNSINVALEEDVSQLKEVMISTGYQNISKKLFTGSAVTLTGVDAKRDGIADVSRMLEGRVAGVSVQNVSGTFGAAPKIRVRGATSITGDNKPLWVVDGVVLEDVINVSNEQLSTGDPSTLLGSAVAGLNSDDIESFQILKDASATSLYGARAMNGVILITTKKGKVGDGSPAISYTANLSSYLKPTYSTFDIMNSYDQMSVYSEMERKGWLNYSTTVNEANGGVYKKLYQGFDFAPGSTTPGIENTQAARSAFLTRYANANTDWFDVLFKNSLMQEHSLSVSTGTEKSQMYYSTSYLKDNGWTIADKVQRFTGNVRGNWKINDKISFGLITTGSIRDQKAPGTLGRTTNPVTGEYSRDFDLNPFSYALNTSRTLTPYDENGNLEYFTRNYAPFNIIEELKNNTLDLTQIDLKIQGEGQYKILKNLTYNFLGSYRYTQSNQEHKVYDNSNTANAYRAGVYPENSFIRDANPYLYIDPLDPDGYPVSVLPNGGIYYTNDDFMKSFFVRNSFDWNQTFADKHIVRVFASQELRYADRQNKQFTGYGYQYDKGGTPFIDPNAIKQAVEGNFNYYSMVQNFDRYVAFAGTGSYSYNNKYQFNGTIRYDGSNQVGESAQARWLPTWNVSGSWNADEEEFMKKQETISKLTLRATYGLTASLGNATNSSLIVRSSSSLRPRLSEIENRLTIASLANSELTWEKQYEFNVGVDVGLFKNRLNVTVDAYRRDGFDLIGQIRNSGIGGEVLKYANYADMVSKGIEGSIGGDIFRKKDWGWKSQITFGYNKGKITNLKGEPSIFDQVGPDGGPQIGRPYRGLYSIDFQKLAEDSGVPFFINETGSLSNDVYLQSSITDYLKYEGPIDPLFNGGFYNSFNYKKFTASVLITFSAGNKVRLNPAYKNVYSDLDAMPNDFLNRFLLYGDNGTPSILEPRNRTALNGAYPYNAYNYSTARVADGGFIRLKSFSFGYILPETTIRRIGFKHASLNLVANNLFLIYSDKKLNGQDPEFFSSGGVALPIPQQFTLSLKVGL